MPAGKARLGLGNAAGVFRFPAPDKHVGDREAIVPDDVPADEDRDKGRLSCRNKPMFQEARPIWIVEHVAATGNSRGVSQVSRRSSSRRDDIGRVNGLLLTAGSGEIGRASCRESVCQYASISVVNVAFKKNQTTET